MSALDALVEEIAERVAAKVLAKLGAPSTHYGTGKSSTLPPGKSRAWALRTLKTIPGARKVGRDWLVSVEDFNAWLTEKDGARVTRKSHVDLRHDVSLEDSLTSAGLRRIR